MHSYYHSNRYFNNNIHKQLIKTQRIKKILSSRALTRFFEHWQLHEQVQRSSKFDFKIKIYIEN